MQVCELAEQLEQDKARCEALVRQDRQEVDQFFVSLEGVLARKKRACLEALDQAAAEVSRVYDPLVHRVKELQVCTHFITVPVPPSELHAFTSVGQTKSKTNF